MKVTHSQVQECSNLGLDRKSGLGLALLAKSSAGISVQESNKLWLTSLAFVNSL